MKGRMNNEVILLQDVKKLVKKGEVVKVADGYGQNFLIKNKLAVLETNTSRKIVESQKEAEHQQDLENQAKAKELAKESDPEIKEMAKMELAELETRLPEIISKLEIELIPKDPNDNKDVIMEIRGAAGGDEGNIFAGDLYRMYVKYAESQGWKLK